MIGQAFENQWLNPDHNKSALQHARYVDIAPGDSSGTEPEEDANEEDADGGIITPVARPRPKKARLDPYQLMIGSEAVGLCPDPQAARSSSQGAAATPLDEDAFPSEVAVESMSEGSQSEASDTDAEINHLEDSAFTRLLLRRVPAAPRAVPNCNPTPSYNLPPGGPQDPPGGDFLTPPRFPHFAIPFM